VSRRSSAAVVVLVLLLVLQAPAAVAQTGGTLVVGSQHTDFGTGDEHNPQRLDNMSVEGTGDDSMVTLSSVQDTVTRPADNGQDTDSAREGLRIETKRAIDSLEFDTSSNTDGATTGYVTYPNGTVIQSSTLSGGTASFSGLGLASGESYYLVVDADGGNYTRGAQGQANFPYTGEALDITAGVFSGEFASTGIAFSINDIRVLEGPSSAEYTSALHDVSNAEQASVNITQLSNVSVDAEVRTDGGTVVGSDTITSTGNHTIDLSETESDELETVLDVEVTGDNPQFELADESVLFNNDAPEIDNASASPTGEISTNTPTLSVNLSDSQFGTAQGEELAVDWYVDGEEVDSTTETSNGTASIQIDAPETGGQHNWSVEVSDQYGATTESETFEFSTPSELTIRNVSAPNDTISGATAELTFYYNDETTRLSDDDGDGVIDMAGLPTDEKFVVVVDADGYHRRHIIIDSIYEQSAVYLLPDNATTVETRFQIDDPTGEFQAGTTEVLVQRSVERDYDGDGDLESRYTTVAADEAGVAGFTTALEEDARYRLIVRNQAGDTRVLGSYTATVAETVVLEPTPLGVELGNESAYNATAGQVNTSSGEELVFEYGDNADATTDLTLAIWEQGNQSHQPSGFENVTVDGPLGEFKHVEPLESDEDGITWVVHYEATRDGEQIAGEFIVGPSIQDPLTGSVPTWLGNTVAIVSLILVAGLFSQLNAGVGAVTTSIVGGGFWWLGFLPPAAGGAVVISLFAALLYKAGGDR